VQGFDTTDYSTRFAGEIKVGVQALQSCLLLSSS
jgi:hypothetical protein